MAGCCVVDVAVLFFLLWWWCFDFLVMKILIGFLSKLSNSNLNLYIVHLWANQCSCGPYVDG